MGPNEAYAMCRWTLLNGSRFACTAAARFALIIIIIRWRKFLKIGVLLLAFLLSETHKHDFACLQTAQLIRSGTPTNLRLSEEQLLFQFIILLNIYLENKSRSVVSFTFLWFDWLTYLCPHFPWTHVAVTFVQLSEPLSSKLVPRKSLQKKKKKDRTTVITNNVDIRQTAVNFRQINEPPWPLYACGRRSSEYIHLLFRLIDNTIKISHNDSNNQGRKHRKNPKVF